MSTAMFFTLLFLATVTVVIAVLAVAVAWDQRNPEHPPEPDRQRPCDP